MDETEFFRMLDWLIDVSIIFEYRIINQFKSSAELILYLDCRNEVGTLKFRINGLGNCYKVVSEF